MSANQSTPGIAQPKPAPGQRWKYNRHNEWGDATILRMTDGGLCAVNWGKLDGKEYIWSPASIMDTCTYLGPASPQTPMGAPLPATGQRWRDARVPPHAIIDGAPFTLGERSVRAPHGGWEVPELSGYVRDDLFVSHLVYVDGPDPVPLEVTTMGADREGWPVRCLSCGGDKEGMPYHCSTCFGTDKIAAHRLTAAWNAGARDFPRSTPVPVTRPGESRTCPACEEAIEDGKIHGCQAGASGSSDGIPPQKDVNQKSNAGIQPGASVGVPAVPGTKPGQLSAFQIIQARERDKAARRVETAAVLATFVDEYDCLPDVGTSWTKS